MGFLAIGTHQWPPRFCKMGASWGSWPTRLKYIGLFLDEGRRRAKRGKGYRFFLPDSAKIDWWGEGWLDAFFKFPR